MAVHKPAPRPVSTQPRRTNAAQAQGPGTVRVGGTIGERRAAQPAQTQITRETAPRGILQSARDVFAHRTSAQAQIANLGRQSYVAGKLANPLDKVTLGNATRKGEPIGRDHALHLLGQIDQFLSKKRKA